MDIRLVLSIAAPPSLRFIRRLCEARHRMARGDEAI
jgi:hypothetical protein